MGYQVLAAVILGIFAGLFFGPLTSVLNPIAAIFTMLVQMVVLPYICFSLIHGLGSISPEMGKKLLRSGWPFFVAIWAIVLFVLFFVQQLIPGPRASYILAAESTENTPLSMQFLKFLVPENPFYDLANNIVPAIAIFGLIVGIALMHIEKKESLCTMLERVNQVIEKILVWLAIISPIGAFAHVAIAFGTVRFEDLYKLEFYVFCFIGMVLFITFWVLPLLLSCLTSMTYREVLKAFRSVCLLPFVTALTPIAIPFLNAYLLRFSKKHETHEKFHENSQTVLPLAYSVGQIGNVVVIFFILFISFYYRHPFQGSGKTLLALLSIPMSLGSSSNSVSAISFLIEQFKFPKESLELFMQTSSITANFQVLMSIASVLTLIILTLYAYYGIIQIKWNQLLIRLGGTLAIFCVLVLSIKSVIQVGDKYQDLYLSLKISDVIENPVKATVLAPGNPGTPRSSTTSSFEQILETGVLKVGYSTVDIPFCYLNNKNQIVGYDIAYAYQFARDLDCRIEFIPIDFNRIGESLDEGLFDIGMSAVLMTEERLKSMSFTAPYSEQNVVLVVPLQNKKEFMDLNAVTENPDLRIGYIGAYQTFLHRHFPKAQTYQAPDIDTAKMKRGELDAWIWTRDTAMVWCLSNPDFAVIDYGGLIGRTYFAFAIKNDAFKFASYLNNCLLLKKLSGFEKKMEDYWIRGEALETDEPRWSILRNVLHVKM